MLEKKKGNSWIIALICYAASLLLATLVPSNIIFPIAAFMLGIYLFTNKRALFAGAVSALVLAVAIGLEATLSVALILPVIIVTGTAARICLARGFATGKIALVCGISFGVTAAATFVGTVYLLGGTLSADMIQEMYTLMLEMMTELTGEIAQVGAAINTEVLEEIVYTAMLSLPGVFLAICSAGGLTAALYAAKTRGGIRPVMSQIVPTKVVAWTYIAGLALYIIFGNGAVGITGYTLMMLLTPILALYCINVLYIGLRTGALPIGMALVIIVLTFIMGPLSALSFGGAYFTLRTVRPISGGINFSEFIMHIKNDSEMSDELTPDIDEDKKDKEETENKSDDTDLRS